MRRYCSDSSEWHWILSYHSNSFSLFLCSFILSLWVHFPSPPSYAFTHAASLRCRMYMSTHPRPARLRQTTSKPVLFHEVFSSFPFSPSLLTLSLNVEMISVFSELSWISFLPLYFTYVCLVLDLFSTFYSLHCKFCKFLGNKIQSNLSYYLHHA